MAARVEAITKRPTVRHQAWKDLSTHHKKVKELHLRQLFAEDPKRGTHMTAEAMGLKYHGEASGFAHRPARAARCIDSRGRRERSAKGARRARPYDRFRQANP